MSTSSGKWVRVGDLKIKIDSARLLLSTPSKFGLSLREREVLCQLACGDGVNEIAKRMGVTANTVNTFKVRLFQKLGIKRSAEAAAIMMAILTGAELQNVDTGRGLELSVPGAVPPGEELVHISELVLQRPCDVY